MSDLPHVLDHLPPAFMGASARTLHEVLPAPTLIHLPGLRPRPVFVSVLLHGNEDAGLLALQSVLAKFGNRPLPRAPLRLALKLPEEVPHLHPPRKPPEWIAHTAHIQQRHTRSVCGGEGYG